METTWLSTAQTGSANNVFLTWFDAHWRKGMQNFLKSDDFRDISNKNVMLAPVDGASA